MPLIDVKKQQEAKAQVNSICRDKLPSNRKLPLWTDLTNPKLADVWLQGAGQLFGDGKSVGANLTSKDEYVKLRNDWYQGNFFRTKAGHMIYIGKSESPDTISILNNKLFGQEGTNYLRFNVDRNNKNNKEKLSGGGWAENFSKLMFLEQTKTWNTWVFKSNPTHNGITYSNWYNLLAQIEQSSIPTNKVIVLTFSDGDIIALDKITKSLKTFYDEYGTYIITGLAIAGTVFTAGTLGASVVKYATQLFNSSKNIIDKVASGQPVTASEIMSASGGLLPEGSEKYVQTALNVGTNVDSYLKTNNPQSLLQASAQLGVKKEQLVSIVEGITGKKGADSASFLLTAMEQSKKIDQTMLTLGVLKAQSIVDTSAFNAETLAMARNFIQGNGGKDSALVQNIATNSLGNVMNGIIPNINNVSKVVLDDMRGKMSQEEFRSWCNMASARNDLDTALPNMAYQSMIQQAIESSNANKPYVLPPDVPKQYRSCMALQLTADTGIPVVDPYNVKSVVPSKPAPPKPNDKSKPKKKLRKEYR
jgi:hypothetical protein